MTYFGKRLVDVIFAVLLVLGFIKLGLWLYDYTVQGREWQRPLCDIHRVKSWDCDRYDSPNYHNPALKKTISDNVPHGGNH